MNIGQLLQDEGVELVSTTSLTIASDSIVVDIHDPSYVEGVSTYLLIRNQVCQLLMPTMR